MICLTCYRHGYKCDECWRKTRAREAQEMRNLRAVRLPAGSKPALLVPRLSGWVDVWVWGAAYGYRWHAALTHEGAWALAAHCRARYAQSGSLEAA